MLKNPILIFLEVAILGLVLLTGCLVNLKFSKEHRCQLQGVALRPLAEA